MLTDHIRLGFSANVACAGGTKTPLAQQPYFHPNCAPSGCHIVASSVCKMSNAEAVRYLCFNYIFNTSSPTHFRLNVLRQHLVFLAEFVLRLSRILKELTANGRQRKKIINKHMKKYLQSSSERDINEDDLSTLEDGQIEKNIDLRLVCLSDPHPN